MVKTPNRMAFTRCAFFFTFCFLIVSTPRLAISAPAGYSEFLIPGDEAYLMQVFDAIGSGDQTGSSGYMHSYISVTAWADNTTVYYDHWEDGYDFDPNDPTTADETYTILNNGESLIFESEDIITYDSVNDVYGRVTTQDCDGPSGPSFYCYDGRDRIYVAGGTATVTRSSWTEATGTLLSLGWEVYPVQPQLTTYILPFGEDLALDGAGDPDLQDFQRVFAQIQATEDNTVIQVDLNQDGVYDSLDWDRDGAIDGTSYTLNKGEVFLLDKASMGDQAIDYPGSIPDAIAGNGTDDNLLVTGTEIQASATVQVQYIIGDETSESGYYEIRGLSAFPRGLWDDEYYAPVDSGAFGADESDGNTDIFLYNPHDQALTIEYQTASGGTGTFTVDPGKTASFREKTGDFAPIGASVYLKGDDVFWGISSVDTSWDSNGWRLGTKHDWAYSLVPAFLLENEHYLGWAPGSFPVSTGADADNSGVFISPAQDNTTVFVDFDGDGFDTGQGDVSYNLSRLDSQFVYDANDGDMSGANIYATGSFTMAYGQNPETSGCCQPAIDVGYTGIPGGGYIDRVLTTTKTTEPAVVGTTVGSTSSYTLTVDTYDFTVNQVSIVDTLPAGWEFVDDSATITMADKTIYTGDDADPVISGATLMWPNPAKSFTLGDMGENQTITIEFTGRTTQTFSAADITRNSVEAIGTRTVQGITQTFVATDFVFNTYSDAVMQVEKTSGGVDPLNPGDRYTYTITVTNPSTASTDLTGIAVYDALPEGVAYVAGTSSIDAPGTLSTFQVRDEFSVSSFSNQDGTDNWAAAWVEGDEDGGASGPGSGRIMVTGGELRLTNNYPSWNNSNDPSAAREVDLSGYTTAILSYDYRTTGVMESDDEAVVEISSNGGTSYTVIGQYFGALSGSATHDISSYISSDTVVRIRLADYYGGDDEYLYIDNIEIRTANDGPVNDPPNLISADDGYDLSPGESLTLTFDVTVDDPLGTGIEEIVNTTVVTSNQFPLGVEDSAVNIVNNPTAESAEVGDRIWFDADGDGAQDVGESGLANVDVVLKDEFGTPIASATTDSNGNFLFTGVEPGDGYYVTVDPLTLPSTTLEQTSPLGYTNRTAPFNLLAGDAYLDADIGYAAPTGAGTATLGDRVWSDGDGNGVQDSGEPGLSGVTVELWRDVDNDGVFEPAGDDASANQPSGYPMSTTTDVGGNYFFFDVAAGTQAGDNYNYFVYVDYLNDAALSGYNPTTISEQYVSDLLEDETLLYFDFGFNNSNTHTIRDRVWIDADGDADDDVGADDNGETGVSGVTVDLLDDSLNVIAGTTTDADGYFSFSGVPGGGADYTVRVTDTAGVLNDFWNTTPSAGSGTFSIDNLTADVDYGAEPEEPHFGYNLSRSIGDTVFNDADGDGDQDAGETGISGVAVYLYEDDGDGVFEPGTGDGDPVASILTDGNGKYLFSGLDDGTYFVHIDETQSTLSGFDTLTTTDDDSASGHQAEIILSGSAADLNADFGYRASVNYTVSGTIWENPDADSQIDAGESAFQGVTVELWKDTDGSGDINTGDVAVATVTTDANGDFTFSGLPEGTYIVLVTDENDVLRDYVPNYELTEGAGQDAAAYNNLEGDVTVDSVNGDQTGINFGFGDPSPTYVVISDFRALEQNNQVIVEWRTAVEIGTIGFHLLRRDDAKGKYFRLNDELLPALLDSQMGGTYSFVDETAVPGEAYTYRLVEVEQDGKKRRYGPFKVIAGPASADVGNEPQRGRGKYSRRGRELSAEKRAKNAAAKIARRFAKEEKKRRKKAGLAKIYVAETGLYHIPAEQIADLLGLPLRKVKNRLRRGRIALSNMGAPVAWHAASDNSGLYFYGRKPKSRYSRENVYWLQKGRGLLMEVVKARPKRRESAEDVDFFERDVDSEENRFPAVGLFTDPEADFWMWDYLFAGNPDLGIKVFTVPSPGAAAGHAGRLKVYVKGATDEGAVDPDHHAAVRVNGENVGGGYWNGLDRHELVLTIPPDLLIDGENQVEVTGLGDTGAATSIFYVDRFELSYKSLFHAENDRLLLNSGGNQRILVSGYTEPEIFAIDLTDARRPKWLTGYRVDETAGEYTVAFAPVTPYGDYSITSAAGILSAEDAWPDTSADLASRRHNEDYVIIAPADFMDAAGTLAQHRESQGLKALLVDVEDVMDEFNGGLFSPLGIHQFLQHAFYHWRRPPKYVLLAGSGTLDYKDYKGVGDNLIPPLLVGTPDGVFASDTLLADVAGEDGVPEMAIGRVPAATLDEFVGYVEKIIGYENQSGDGWARNVLMLADRPDAGAGRFVEDSEDLISLLPADYIPERIFLSETPLATARRDLIDRINSGAGYLHYIGHASDSRLSNSGLLTTADMESLNNAPNLPVVTLMTCLAGRYDFPGWDSLGEALVLHPDGGAAAVWGASGLSLNRDAKVLFDDFFGQVFGNETDRVGSAILKSQQFHGGNEVSDYMLGIYNLLGDPALQLKLK